MKAICQSCRKAKAVQSVDRNTLDLCAACAQQWAEDRANADEVARWVGEVGKRRLASGHGGLGGQGEFAGSESTASTKSTLTTKIYPEIASNAALTLLAVACALLDRQVARLAEEFETKGGFTERLYRVRKQKRGF